MNGHTPGIAREFNEVCVMVMTGCRFCVASRSQSLWLSAILFVGLSLSTLHAAEIVGLDGQAQTVTDLKFEPGWKVTGKTESGEPLAVSAHDLTSIQVSDRQLPAVAIGQQILIGNDEVLVCSIVGSDIESLSVQSPVVAGAKIPISATRGAILARNAGENQITALRQLIRKTAGTGDAVRLENGDVVKGTLLEVQPKQVLFERDGTELEIERERVHTITFDPSLYSYDLGSDFYAQARLSDGSVLNVRDAKSVDAAIEMTLGCGAVLTVPLAELVDLSFRNGRILYLSDQQPTKMEVVPFLDDATPPRMNAAATGTPLRLAGKTFTKGIGVRSRTLLQYDLAGKFERFQSTIGVDAAAGTQASVRFVVLVDGEEKFDSGLMSATSDPVPVDVSVTDAKTLELLVDFGERGDVDDFANWCNARLLR